MNRFHPAAVLVATMLGSALVAGDPPIERKLVYRNASKRECVLTLSKDFKDGKVEIWKERGNILATLSKAYDSFKWTPNMAANGAASSNYVMTISAKSKTNFGVVLSGGSLTAPVEFKCEFGQIVGTNVKLKLTPLDTALAVIDSNGYYSNSGMAVHSQAETDQPYIIFK